MLEEEPADPRRLSARKRRIPPLWSFPGIIFISGLFVVLDLTRQPTSVFVVVLNLIIAGLFLIPDEDGDSSSTK